MPLPVEGLTPNSSDEEIKKAISDSIAQCVNEGKEQDMCVAMTYNMAKGATGKTLAPKKPTTNVVSKGVQNVW